MTPIYWGYYGYDPGYWDYAPYRQTWINSINEYYNDYGYVDASPDIYLPPAMVMAPSSESIQYLESGTELFSAGNYLLSLEQFRLATLLDLDFAVPKFAYAQALFALGFYYNASYEIYLGLKLMPEWLEFGGDITLMYGVPEDFETQLYTLMDRIRAWPEDLSAVLVLGYVSFFSGDIYTAEKAFQKLTVSLNPADLYVADLFLNAIQAIKQELAQTDPEHGLMHEDQLSLEEVLRR